MNDNAFCKDFKSSYPYNMLANKMPVDKFAPYPGRHNITQILEQAETYAFIFKLTMVNVRLKDPQFPMPPLQHYKCEECHQPVIDNGRILAAGYVEIYMNEVDLKLIHEYYTADMHLITDCYYAYKDYLPRWFTDYVFQCFVEKEQLKDGDPVLYNIAKARLNSLYGMCVQKPVKDDIIEDYKTGEYEIAGKDPEALYQKYIENHNSILPYQWGVWVTSYAMVNLFELGKCFEYWLYSDTDSVYGIHPDNEKIKAYNESCKEKLRANGYGPAIVKGKEKWLGIAEDDGEYIEFITVGAKRYAKRDIEGNLKITVAGVPKKGASCLNDDIRNFKKGFVFPGTKTGKLTHEHIYVPEIYIDEDGNETGDSINLTPCDYLLDQTEYASIEDIMYDEVSIQEYDLSE